MPRRKSVNEEKKSGEVKSEPQLRWCHDSALYFFPSFRPSALRQEGRGGRGRHRRQPRRGQDHRGRGHRECQQSGLPDHSFHVLLETERLLLGRPQHRAAARVDQVRPPVPPSRTNQCIRTECIEGGHQSLPDSFRNVSGQKEVFRISLSKQHFPF